MININDHKEFIKRETTYISCLKSILIANLRLLSELKELNKTKTRYTKHILKDAIDNCKDEIRATRNEIRASRLDISYVKKDLKELIQKNKTKERKNEKSQRTK